MGRKIPGKKHHGVKDPNVQRATRNSLLKTKINARPKNIEEQEIPKKLQIIMNSKTKNEILKEEKRRRNKMKALRKKLGSLDSSKDMPVEKQIRGTKSVKSVPIFKQEEGESQIRFLNRMGQEVRSILQRSKYEDKYDVELVENSITGLSSFKPREKDELEREFEERKLATKSKKKGIVLRTKEEKRQMKREKEKMKRSKKSKKTDGEELVFDFSDLSDKVSFNDVVSHPPNLSVFSKSFESRLPAAKKNLILTLKQKDKSASSSSIDKQVMLENERNRVITEYRNLKKKKKLP